MQKIETVVDRMVSEIGQEIGFDKPAFSGGISSAKHLEWLEWEWKTPSTNLRTAKCKLQIAFNRQGIGMKIWEEEVYACAGKIWEKIYWMQFIKRGSSEEHILSYKDQIKSIINLICSSWRHGTVLMSTETMQWLLSQPFGIK